MWQIITENIPDNKENSIPVSYQVKHTSVNSVNIIVNQEWFIAYPTTTHAQCGHVYLLAVNSGILLA